MILDGRQLDGGRPGRTGRWTWQEGQVGQEGLIRQVGRVGEGGHERRIQKIYVCFLQMK